jgi:hypothetical protein
MLIDSEYDPGEDDREDPDMPDDWEPEEDYYPESLYGQ